MSVPRPTLSGKRRLLLQVLVLGILALEGRAFVCFFLAKSAHARADLLDVNGYLNCCRPSIFSGLYTKWSEDLRSVDNRSAAHRGIDEILQCAEEALSQKDENSASMCFANEVNFGDRQREVDAMRERIGQMELDKILQCADDALGKRDYLKAGTCFANEVDFGVRQPEADAMLARIRRVEESETSKKDQVGVIQPVPRPSAKPTGKRGEYSIVKVEDESYLREGMKIHRKVVRVTVSSGLSRQALIETLEGAGRSIIESQKADAVMVFGYRNGDEVAGQYTAGRCVIAPGGKWELAHERESSARLEAVADVNSLYFKPATPSIAGKAVVLRGHSFDTVGISGRFESWTEGDIVAWVPSGTKATIVEEKRVPLYGNEIVRFKVHAVSLGQDYYGWVNPLDVEF